MSIKSSKLSLDFEPATTAILEQLAHQEHKSITVIAKELILEALERREDVVLSALAEAREQENQKTVSHEDAWK
jgi:DNA-binding LacI/PurR family transcriptional regulator